MRIVAVLRLYSGFEESLALRIWRPQGLPSIYKWLSNLDKRCDLFLTFTAKDSGTTYKSSWLYPTDTLFSLKEFHNPIRVLAGIAFFRGLLPRKIGMVMRELRQAGSLVWICYRLKPDIVYFDSANVLVAAVVARMFRSTPVVIRVLGVCTWWWSIIESLRWIDRLYRYVYQSTHFALVVGTQDGSGTEYWFEKVLPASTPRLVSLNGVDVMRSDDPEVEAMTLAFKELRRNGCRIVLFVGRLESYKGVDYFLSEMFDLLKTINHQVHFVVVGSGNLLNYSIARVASAGYAGVFSFMGAIPHEYIINFHEISDIYISTNFDGNLTNANLEAIACNDCILIPRSVTNEYVDRQTVAWLGESACFYDREGQESLRNKVRMLIEIEGEIEVYKRHIAQAKRKFLRTWDDRFDEEFRLLCDLVGSGQRATALSHGVKK
jgi:glycosyltransferase involved in cell wall biosynthesis